MNRPPEAVMLFAAGFGSRMGALTRDVPKPLIQVNNRPLISYALDLARNVNPSRIVANLHYKPEQLAAFLKPQGVLLSIEWPDILETGGGLRAALPLLGPGPVFTMNTDAIWGGVNPLNLALQAWDPDAMDALLVCVPVEQALGYQGVGDFVADARGRISRGPGLVYGGVQILKPGGLHEIKDSAFSLNLLWTQMQAQGRLFAVHYPGHWCDVGHPDGIKLAEAMLQGNRV
jgi:N-acetyl-alpha-D-muramate 1-phosphate uridylyltransferase